MAKDTKKSFRNPSTNIAKNIAQNSNITKAPDQTAEPLMVNKISMVAVNRTPTTVGDWRLSHISAESIYFPNRSRLYDLYKDTELDGHLTGIVEKRVKTVLNKKIRFVKDNKDVEGVCDLIESTKFRIQNRELLMRNFWGLTGFEFIPGEKFDFKIIPRKHIKPEARVIAHFQTDYEGTPYEDIDNIWVVAEDRDLGLYLKAAFYVLLKKGDFADWANYIELFGQPVIVTKYDAYDAKTKDQLTAVIDNIGSSLRLAIPKQADFEIMDGKTSNGTGDLQEKFKNACNEELSVLILGNTETTKSSNSSGYAQSQTHGRQQSEVIKDDIHYLLSLLNSDKYLSILKSYGYDVEGGKFIVEEMMEVADQKTRAEVLNILKNDLGLPLDDDTIYEEFGINKPANYEEQKAKQKAKHEAAETPEEEAIEDAAEGDKPKPAIKQPVKPKPIPAKAKLSALQSLRAMLADFFDHAHKD